MVDHLQKNFPVPTKETAAYWDGCRNHKLLIQQCTKCGTISVFSSNHLYRLHESQVEWVQSSGQRKGKKFHDNAPCLFLMLMLLKHPT